MKFRMDLEADLLKMIENHQNSTPLVNAYNQICFLNFVRATFEENYFIAQSSFDDFLKLVNSSEYAHSIELISKQTKHHRMIRDFLSVKDQKETTQLNKSSPSAKRSPYGKRLVDYKQLALQTCELNDLRKFVAHHASLAGEANLKMHWNKWSKNIVKLLQFNESTLNESSFTNIAFLKQFFQLENQIDIDFYYICLAKLYELIEIKVSFFVVFLFALIVFMKCIEM